MPATKARSMRREPCLELTTGSVQRVWNRSRAIFLISALFGSALLLACSGSGGGVSYGSASTDPPELTDEIIRERINDAAVWDIPEENGSSHPITWRFFQNEPKEITVVEKQVEGVRATIILDIITTSSPRSREQRYLAGQIRTEWELRTGWVLRQWEIVKTENISMKYKNLPKPPAQNPNR